MITITFRRTRPTPDQRLSGVQPFEAVVTDNAGQKWVWFETISERQAEYQGPMSMLGPTHKTTAYDVPNYGLVPESLKYSDRISQVIIERFKEHPEEFGPFHPTNVKRRS